MKRAALLAGLLVNSVTSEIAGQEIQSQADTSKQAEDMVKDSQAVLPREYGSLLQGTDPGGKIIVDKKEGTWIRKSNGTIQINFNLENENEKSHEVILSSSNGNVTITEQTKSENNGVTTQTKVISNFDGDKRLLNKESTTHIQRGPKAFSQTTLNEEFGNGVRAKSVETKSNTSSTGSVETTTSKKSYNSKSQIETDHVESDDPISHAITDRKRESDGIYSRTTDTDIRGADGRIVSHLHDEVKESLAVNGEFRTRSGKRIVTDYPTENHPEDSYTVPWDSQNGAWKIGGDDSSPANPSLPEQNQKPPGNDNEAANHRNAPVLRLDAEKMTLQFSNGKEISVKKSIDG